MLLWAKNEHRVEYIKIYSADFDRLEPHQTELFRSTERFLSTFDELSPPSPASLSEVRENPIDLVGALSTLEAPSRSKRVARDYYRQDLSALVGSINSYDGSEESFQSFENASQRVVNVGAELERRVSRFTGSVWRSFFGILFQTSSAQTHVSNGR